MPNCPKQPKLTDAAKGLKPCPDKTKASETLKSISKTGGLPSGLILSNIHADALTIS